MHTYALLFNIFEFIKLISANFPPVFLVSKTSIQYCGNEHIAFYQIYWLSLLYLQSWYCNECHDRFNLLTFEWLLLLLFEKCNDVKIVVDFKSRQCPLLLWNLNELKQWNKWSKISKQHTQTDSVLFTFGLFAFGKSIVFGTQWKKKSKFGTQMKNYSTKK